MKHLSLPLLLCMLLSCLTPAFGLNWATSLDEAKQRAQAEGKLVLAVVYGSAWTRKRMKMRERIMDDARFCTYAEGKFVPVEMYEPEDRTQADAIWKHRGFCLEYGINQWPTTLVMRPDGIPTGGLMGVPGYGGNHAEYEDMDRINITCTALDNALHVAEKLKEAEAKDPGDGRLYAMASAYYRIPQNLRARLVLAKYIADMDPQDKTGMRDEYLDAREMINWDEIGRYGMDHATALRRMQEMIDRARPANRLTMLKQRYNYQGHHIESEDDVRAHNRAAEELAAELDKTSPEEAAKLRSTHEKCYGGDPAVVFPRLQAEKEQLRRENQRRRQQREKNSRPAPIRMLGN